MLTGRQRAHLRGLGHHLRPVVMIGREGPAQAVVQKAAAELENHELIKVKVGEGCLESAREVGPPLAASTGAELVQVLGRTLLLYRRRAKDPAIVLP